MTTQALAVRALTRAKGDPRLGEAAMFAVCGVLDSVALLVLLRGVSHTPPFDGLTAAILHAAAVVCMWEIARSRPSRRWLAVAATMAVPLIGVVLAAAVHFTRGQGLFVHERPRVRRRNAPTLTALRRVGAALSMFDALECGNEEQRREALWALSGRTDPEAIALLRRASAGADADLALSAALVLDEIGERTERKLWLSRRSEVRDAAV